MSETTEFPKDQWDTLKGHMEAGGAEAVEAFIRGFEDPLQRRQLHLFASGQFALEDWPGKNLDGYIAVARAAITECAQQAEDEPDLETSRKRLDLANVISYNLSAKLADCWDDKDLGRERRHFEVGLEAANDCLRWRFELEKGPYPRSIAAWAKGMHELSLGDAAIAAATFERSLELAVEHVEASTEETPDAERHFGVALGEGYLGIAEAASGAMGGRERYDRACAAFGKMAEDAEKKGDADFGLEQIRTVWSRYGES